MTRALTSDMQNALQAQHLVPVYLAELVFTTTTLRLSTLAYDISWNAQTWQGSGILLHPGETSESIDLNAAGITVVLDGQDTSTLSLALGNTNQSKTAKVWFGLLNSSGAIIADPCEMFYGQFDSAVIKDTGRDRIIELNYENELLSQRSIVERRYTHYSQQAYFPGDKGFIYAPQAAEWDGWWGTAEKINFIKKRKTRRN